MNFAGQAIPVQTGRTETERRVLSAVQSAGALASAEIARRTGLSAQSVSVLTRTLEADGLLTRGDPMRGKVGKPQVPISLNPAGAFAFGLKIGRRRADLVLMDFSGEICGRKIATHPYPTPHGTIAFLRKGIAELAADLTASERTRLSGIGIGAPFEIWNWLDIVDAPKDEMMAWKGFSFAEAIAGFSDLPVSMANDATLAATAEQVFGAGRDVQNFAYFHVGTFIGGGLILDGKVWPGPTGNAGAFGSIPVGDTSKPGHQLIHKASLYDLERRLAASGLSGERLRERPPLDPETRANIRKWMTDAAPAIAGAALATVAVIDLDLVILDTALTRELSCELTETVRQAMEQIDRQGIRTPSVITGELGGSAGALGAAYMPIASRFLTGGSRLAEATPD